MPVYYWSTEEQHFDNNVTMGDWLNNEMGEDWELIFLDGTYAEVQTPEGKIYEVHASGDGDSFNHKVELIEMVKADQQPQP